MLEYESISALYSRDSDRFMFAVTPLLLRSAIFNKILINYFVEQHLVFLSYNVISISCDMEQ